MTTSCQPSQTRFPEVGEYLCAKRAMVNGALEGILAGNRTSHDDLLHSSMRYSLLSGGKRIRPILTLAVAEFLGVSAELALQAACAAELIHCASLMLDDLPCMDNMSIRRGRHSNHLVFGEDVTTLSAINLLTLAYQALLSYASGDPTLAYSLLRAMNDAVGADGLIGGQIGDLHPEQLPRDYGVFHTVYERKTGRLFSFAVESGARIGGASTAEFDCLASYAKSLGLVFQICDDILDSNGDPKIMGKEIAMDEGKQTLPKFTGLESSMCMARGLVEFAASQLASFGDRASLLVQVPWFVFEQVPGVGGPVPEAAHNHAAPIVFSNHAAAGGQF